MKPATYRNSDASKAQDAKVVIEQALQALNRSKYLRLRVALLLALEGIRCESEAE